MDLLQQKYWGKVITFFCILAIVFYMYYTQTFVTRSYNWKWTSNNITDVPTTSTDDEIDATANTAEYINRKIYGDNTSLDDDTDISMSISSSDEIENNLVTTHDGTINLQTVKRIDSKITTTTVSHKEDLRVRTILQWSPGTNSPFYHMGKGKTNFIKLSCPYVNCFVTDNKRYFSNITQFDAIIFNGNFVIFKEQKDLPQYRSPTQVYVFGATESAHNNPACKPVLDNFFNWTYTYRLDSDVRWSYIVIYDINGTEFGPKPDIVWPDKMDPIDDYTKAILDGKSKTVAWFVSHCNTLSHREVFAKNVEKEFKKIDSKMTVDIYGACGKLRCPRSSADRCYGLVKRDYYFYFSFENSFAEDYVTEKLLTALNNYAVPVVFGGADYSRYLPPGSYLNARELGPEKLAITMKEIIDNKTQYYDFFRWRNHFKYKQGENDTEICNICTALNDPQKVGTDSLYEDFRDWWYADWEKHGSCK